MNIRRETLYSALPLVVITVINLISVPLFLNYLGEQKYALWFYVLTLSGAFGFADMGMGVATGRFVGLALSRRDEWSAREYWVTGHWVGVLLLVIMALIFLGIGVFLGVKWFNVSPADRALLKACFIAGAGQLWVAYYLQIWLVLAQAHLDFGFIAAVRVGGVMMSVTGSLILAYWTGNPLVLIVWTLLMGGVQTGLFIFRAIYRYGFGVDIRGFRKTCLKEMIPFSLKTFLNLLVSSPSYGMDRILLGRLAPAPSFAHFTVAANVGQRVHGLGVSIMGPIFHHTNRAGGRAEASQAAAIFFEGFQLIWIFGVAGLSWMAVWHDVFLGLWLGSERGAAVAQIFLPILIGWVLRSISSVSAAQLGSFDRLGTTLGFVVLNMLMTGLGVYGGWRWAGLPGAAWGFAAAQSMWMVQDGWVARMVGRGGWWERANMRWILFYGGVAGIFWGLRWAFGAGGDYKGWGLALGQACVLAIGLIGVLRTSRS